MKESISNAMVFSIVITVVSICAGIVFFSMGYSKTYKIKGKLVDIIEEYHGYSDSNTALKDEIDNYLKTVGYATQSSMSGPTCPDYNGESAINTLGKYKYCVYEHTASRGKYYTVRVYMTFNLPLIGDFFNLHYSIVGDTKTIYSI